MKKWRSHTQSVSKFSKSKRDTNIMLSSQNLENVLHSHNLVYSWGSIENKGATLYKQAKPHMQDCKNIITFSCGNNHTIAVDAEGSVYGLGSNEQGQLGMFGERLSKNFRKVNNNMLYEIKKVFCICDCTFFVNEDSEVFICGKYSYKSTLSII